MGTLVRLPPGQEMTAGILKAIIEKCGTCNPCHAAGSATGSPGNTGPNYHCCCGYCTDDPIFMADNSPPATLNATVKFSCIDTKTCTLTKSHACGTTSGARLTYTYTSTTLVRGTCLDAFGLIVNWGPVPELSVTLYCESDVSCLRWQVSAQRRSTTESATIASGFTGAFLLPQGGGFNECGVISQMSCSPFYVYLRQPVVYGSLIVCPSESTGFLGVGQTPCFNCDGTYGEVTITL